MPRPLLSRLCLLLCLPALLLGLLPPHMPAAAAPVAPAVDTASPFGVVATLANRVRQDELPVAVALLRESGAQWQREEIFWDRVQKEPGGPFFWQGDGSGFYNYDAAIEAQVAAGINVLGLLTYNPYWFKSKNPPPEAWIDDWGAYVYATVARYGRDRGWITHWELWNEPNVRESGYESGLYEIKDFVRILEVGRAAALAADPEARIVMGGMSGLTEVSAPFDYDALEYLDQVGALGGWQHVDVLALHPYHPAPPEAPIQRFERQVTLQDELRYLDTLMQRYGHKPVWITELGWSTNQGWPGVSEQAQAHYLVRAYLLALAHPTVEKIFWYDFRNDTYPDAPYSRPVYNSREVEFHYGLLRRSYPLDPAQADLRKPAFLAFRAMTQMLAGLELQSIAANGNAPDMAGFYWYRFAGEGRRVDVLWRVGEAAPAVQVRCDCREALVRAWDGRVLQVLYPVAGMLTLQAGAPGAPLYIEYDPPTALDGLRFLETGRSLRGAFLNYWQERGGVIRFGFPITDELIEPEAGTGRPRVVQYFERARFEHYPEYSGSPSEVRSDSLSLGWLALQRSGGDAVPAPAARNTAGCRLFASDSGETVALCPPFRAVWERYTAVAPLGAPLENARMVVLPESGTVRQVQYFTHARLEHFPEYAGTPFEVQFGLLGRELFTSVGEMP
jgi:hypothetical protein